MVLGQRREGHFVTRAVASVDWVGRGSDHAPPSLHETPRRGSPRKPEDKHRTHSSGSRDGLQPRHTGQPAPVPARDMKFIVCLTQDYVWARWCHGELWARSFGAVTPEAARLAQLHRNTAGSSLRLASPQAASHNSSHAAGTRKDCF